MQNSSLAAQMSELSNLPQQFHKSPATEVSREKSRHVSKSIRSTLAQAVDLKDLAYETAMELKEHGSPEQEESLRARAQAVASAIKA